MTDLEILEAARELLSNEARWTRGTFARDEGDQQVDIHDADAVCWCALGAIDKVADRHDWPPYFGAERLLNDVAFEMCRIRDAAEVNDKMGYEATLVMYDRAIERAKATR